MATEGVLDHALLAAVGEIMVDSRRTIADELVGSAVIHDRIRHLVEPTEAVGRALSEELTILSSHYSVPFFGSTGVSTPFIVHDRFYEPPQSLGFVATKEFTGVVIVATGLLPRHGNGETEARVVPALFPRIRDEQAGIVAESAMADPEALERWGFVRYVSDVESVPVERVGRDPLRTIARGVFGINDTDLIISADAAEMLNAIPANQALVAQGRIVVVIDEPAQMLRLPDDLTVTGDLPVQRPRPPVAEPPPVFETPPAVIRGVGGLRR